MCRNLDYCNLLQLGIRAIPSTAITKQQLCHISLMLQLNAPLTLFIFLFSSTAALVPGSSDTWLN